MADQSRTSPGVDECEDSAVDFHARLVNVKQAPRLMNVKTAQRLNFNSGL